MKCKVQKKEGKKKGRIDKENRSPNRNFFDNKMRRNGHIAVKITQRLAQEARAAVVSAIKPTENIVFVLNDFLKFKRPRRRVFCVLC